MLTLYMLYTPPRSTLHHIDWTLDIHIGLALIHVVMSLSTALLAIKSSVELTAVVD